MQIPLRTADLLHQAGHEVHLVVNGHVDGETLPACLPHGVPVLELPDTFLPARLFPMRFGAPTGIVPAALPGQLHVLRGMINGGKYDVLHFFGTERIARMAGCLASTNLNACVAMTFNSFASEKWWAVPRFLWRRLSLVLTSTECVARRLRANGIPCAVLRHGIVRDFAAERQGHECRTPFRVLFWRNGTPANGADITLEAFERLAPRLPHVSFDLAVRVVQDVPDIGRRVERYPNVTCQVFPYEPGNGIANLLQEALCVVLPFRETNYHPQMALLESAALGIPTITTAVGSNQEVIHHEKNGLIVPTASVDSVTASIERILLDEQLSARLRQSGAEHTARIWNWDGYLERLTSLYLNAM